MGFQVASQAASTDSVFRRRVSLFSGSIALGGGVWSMHFIGMLAFVMCTPVDYGWGTTAISLLPAIVASWTALHFLTRHSISYLGLLVNGTLMGAGIGAMHYIGMAAMEMAPLLRYDLGIFLLSIVVAVFFSCVSLWIKFKLKSLFKLEKSTLSINLIAGAVMGVAISGMHYTGMAAARFVMPPGFEPSDQSADISIYLALFISIITISITGIVLATNLIFKYKDSTNLAIRNEKRLKAVLNTAADGILTINEAGKIINVNASVQRILGWSVNESLGKSVDLLLPSDKCKNLMQFVADYMQTKDQQSLVEEHQVIALDKYGTEIPVRLKIGHVEQDNQHIFIGFIKDLRQRQEMEAALRENEAKFRSLISNIPGITFRCEDSDTWPMVFISDAVESITGYPAEDFLIPNPKRSFTELFVPEDLNKVQEILAFVSDSYAIEYRIKDKDGNIKWMMEYGRRMHSDDGKRTYLDGLIMDITERKHMEDALVVERNNAQAAAEARAAFMANMSHEIRTPMNAIIGFSDILLEQQMTDEQIKFISTIHQSAHSLLHIINDILDSAKLEKGELSLEYRNFSIIELVDSVISTFALQAHRKGIDLQLTMGSSLQGLMHGAPERLRQVLINIVGNAIKFTEKGYVNIYVDKSDDDKSLRIKICDQGIGMSEAQLAKVFDPFIQADASMSRKYGGTGLGTTIAKQLVELMGGQISATSELGVGTCFNVEIPLLDAQEEDVLDNKTVLAQSLPELRILIADDVQQNLDLLSLLLSREGHQVVSVQNGQEVLDKLNQDTFDLVLMDVQMPVLDGLSAARQRRQYERANKLSPVPIIALTASVLENDRIAAQRAGMEGFTNKPINKNALFNEMAKVLKLGPVFTTQDEQTLDKKAMLNLNYALSLWGTEKALIQELQRVQRLKASFVELASEQATNDQHATSQKLHQLKGVVGNLGLEQMHQCMSWMEKHLTTGDTQNYLLIAGQLINKFEHIPELVSGIKQSPQHSETDINKRIWSRESLVSSLKTLLDDVKRSHVDDDAWQQLSENLPSEYLHQVDQIKDEIDDFEFELAAQAIEKLLSEIESELNDVYQ
ncbi:MHYT domain-containing protein [Glaciecola sp. 1036]|uniref:MHYT domain-containing protein n=1 Tax=Alteromonadaceae TaxID=72275 RepID=UPI003D07CF2A